MMLQAHGMAHGTKPAPKLLLLTRTVLQLFVHLSHHIRAVCCSTEVPVLAGTSPGMLWSMDHPTASFPSFTYVLH